MVTGPNRNIWPREPAVQRKCRANLSPHCYRPLPQSPAASKEIRAPAMAAFEQSRPGPRGDENGKIASLAGHTLQTNYRQAAQRSSSDSAAGLNGDEEAALLSSG